MSAKYKICLKKSTINEGTLGHLLSQLSPPDLWREKYLYFPHLYLVIPPTTHSLSLFFFSHLQILNFFKYPQIFIFHNLQINCLTQDQRNFSSNFCQECSESGKKIRSHYLNFCWYFLMVWHLFMYVQQSNSPNTAEILSKYAAYLRCVYCYKMETTGVVTKWEQSTMKRYITISRV